jgi:hypothetical protein
MSVDLLHPSERDAVNKALQLLTEHFENLVLCVNWVNEAGETLHFEQGVGNHLANVRQVELWLEEVGDYSKSYEGDEDDDE